MLLAGLLLLLGPVLPGPGVPLGAQEGQSRTSTGASATAGPRAYRGDQGETRVPAPHVESSEVDVDGILSEEVWTEAASLQGFTQYDPLEAIPASQPTEVLVMVSADALLVGIRAFDDDPDGIRATLSERDDFTRSDDWVRILLDTFDDQRRAYVFTVNAYGVQHDGLWLEGGDTRGFGPPIDDNPDFVWESDARRTSRGWEAELRIPFKSLRFPELADQAWGLNVLRRVQRTGYESSWAPITGDAVNRLGLSGRLTGLTDLDPGLFLELNPVFTGSRTGELDEDAQLFETSDVEGEVGLNATWGLTSNLVLDATINPDFSQVESDAGQIAVNERFALFFPEQRPFFLEGTEIFNLPQRLIFTRTVANPSAGAKVTGKLGATNVGYLGAVDQDDDDDVLVNIVRLRRDLGASSTLGLFGTDRSTDGSTFNRVGGLDGRFVLGDRYTLTLLGAGSWTGDADEADRGGGLASVEFQRSGRELSYTLSGENITPDFEAESGFLRRVGYARFRGEVEVNRFGGPGALVERWGPGLQLEGTWDHDRFWDGGGVQEAQLQASVDVSFRSRIFLFLTYTRDFLDFPRTGYEGLATVTEPGDTVPFVQDQDLFSGLDGISLRAFFSSWEKVRGNARLGWSETAIFDRGADVPVERARALQAEVGLDLFPLPALRGELDLRHETLIRDDGDRYSSATIPRLRLQYQFSRSVFVRAIGEYSAQEREPIRDPATGRVLVWCDPEEPDASCDRRGGSDDNDLYVEGLLGYEPSPGTVVFVGYSRELEDRSAFRFDELEAQADGLFVKVSYRFRF